MTKNIWLDSFQTRPFVKAIGFCPSKKTKGDLPYCVQDNEASQSQAGTQAFRGFACVVLTMR